MKPMQAGSTTPAIELSASDRQAILERVLTVLAERFYAPERLNQGWYDAVDRYREKIESAENADSFEQAMTELLEQLQTSHLGFFHSSARRASSKAALSADYMADETPFGLRWIFQDVHPGGLAARAGIESGDILLRVADKEIRHPEHPVFAMGQKTKLEVIDKNDRRRIVTIDIAAPKGKKLHYLNPTLVESRHLGDGLGYLRVAAFPGMVGVEVANEISDAIDRLEVIDRLILDLRGNTGGGLGALRIMSLLAASKIPVGFALDRRRAGTDLDSGKHRFPRFSQIPASKRALWPLALKFGPAMMAKKPVVLETEGLGPKRFHGRVSLLVNRYTASAAEMIVAFARENHLATIIGENTAGRLLSGTSVKVGHGFRLALPTGAYYTWQGWMLEGTPIEPDQFVPFDWRQRRIGIDSQLQRAMEHARQL